MSVRTSDRLALGFTILSCIAGSIAAVWVPPIGIVASLFAVIAYVFSQRSNKALQERIDRLQRGDDPIMVRIAYPR